MKTLSETFPLWIDPWISGIYALHEPDRCQNDEVSKGSIPAVLTSYCDEFGDANLMMHVPDYTEMTGGAIEWCHYVGVKWRGGNSVALYGRKDEAWRIELKMEIPLSAEETSNLVMQRFRGGEDSFVGRPQEIASALIPYLPFANRLKVWDGNASLDCLEADINELRNDEMIKFVIDREVIPVSETWILSESWHELESSVSPLAGHPRLVDENFVRSICRRDL